MVGTAYYNLTQSQGEVASFAEQNLLGFSENVASEIERLLLENLRTSATLAGEPLIADYLAGSEEVRQELEPLIYRSLQNFADTHPDYDAPGLLDANGIVIASLTDVLIGRDRSFRDYFTQSIGGTPYVSDISVGRATGRPGIFITNPVITDEGEIVGIDIIWLKGDTIWDIIDGVKVGEEGIAYLIDQDGVIIAHPNRELLYHSLTDLTSEATDTISSTIRFGVNDDETPLIPESLGLDDLGQELLSADSPGNFHYYSTLDNRNHVVGYSPMPEQGWTVVVDLPEDQFLAPLQRLGTITWISVGIVAVIVLVISILLTAGITRPISRLTNAAIAVENDQPFEPSDIADVTAGGDEIADLGRVFSNMVVALRARMAELQTVYEIGQDITATLEVDETLQAILNRVKDVIAYDAAEITLFDRQANELIVTAWQGEESYQDTRGSSYKLGTGFTGAIAEERTSMLVADIQEAEREAIQERLGDGTSIRSLLGVPLLIRDRLVGTLQLVSSQVGAFGADEERLLETISPQAAIAIEKAQQVREREQTLRNEIKKLRIEIDEVKRARQVEEITETDYFRELTGRAAEMRRRAQQASEASEEEE
jgi:putative methionine-R-sulfoxide reductase with GAF domain